MNASTEKSVKHTPGSWRAVADDDFAPTHIVLVLDPHDEQVAYTGDLLKSWDECEANARLIAASPDLLETAEAFLAWFRENAGHVTIGGDDELKRGFEDRARALATACHDATEGRQS